VTPETTDNKRKRLLFRSWHRGTRELDLLMGTFAERHLQDMTAEELDLYDEILTHSDPDLYNWITAQEPAPANFMNPVMEKLLQHKTV
jgi:antitoxin CptB